MNRLLRSLPALLVMLLAGLALAQFDQRSRELLEGMTMAQQPDIQTMDQTMVMTTYQGGEFSATTRTLIDYVNRRAVILSELPGGISSRMVHKDGATTMSMAGLPISIPAPPEMASTFDNLFDPAQNMLDQDATAVYDGVVSYGELVTGQQVTYTGRYEVMGSTQDTVVRFLFDDADQYIAQVVEMEPGQWLVSVFDDGVSDIHTLAGRNATMYIWDGQTASLYAEMRFEDVRLNEPLDESLFD